ncbi:MAG: CoA ester lyase [Aquiluna sp.]
MRAVRSALFVPGHKADWIQKALNSEADSIIIDLEDAVPEAEKAVARENAREALSAYQGETLIIVRVNPLDTPHFGRDIHAVANSHLAALLLPKVFSRDDMIRYDGLVLAAEIENGVPLGSVEVLPSFETARAIKNASEIMSSPRVGGIMAAAARDADISREVGFKWSPEGHETLFLRSKLVVEARAAGLRCLLVGLWQEVKDLDGLEAFASDNSALGYSGQVIIHPSHAGPVNSAYGLSDKEIDYYRRLVSAFDDATRDGHGAVSFDGDHIDKAHALHAQELLNMHEKK